MIHREDLFKSHQAPSFNILRPLDYFRTEHLLETVRAAIASRNKGCTLDYRVIHHLLRSPEKIKDKKVRIRGQFTPRSPTARLRFVIHGETKDNWDGNKDSFYNLMWLPEQDVAFRQQEYRRLQLAYFADKTIEKYFEKGESKLEKQLENLSTFAFPVPITVSEAETLLKYIKTHLKPPYNRAGLDYAVARHHSLRRKTADEAVALSRGISLDGYFQHPLLPGSLDFSLKPASANKFSALQFGSEHQSVFARFDDYRKKKLAGQVLHFMRAYFFKQKLRDEHPALWQGSPDIAPVYATNK